MSTKGDWPRPIDKKKFDDGYERTFRWCKQCDRERTECRCARDFLDQPTPIKFGKITRPPTK